MKGNVLRVVSGGAVLAVLMTIMVMPASAAVTTPTKPTVEVITPDIGAYYRRGSLWIVGIACDPNAAASDSTAGIAKVAVYAGNRDDPTAEPTVHSGRGGYVGSATIAGTLGTGSGIDITAVLAETSRLGIGNPDLSVCKNPNAGWRVLTSAFKKGAYNLNIYALAKNGAETQVTRNVRIDLP